MPFESVLFVPVLSVSVPESSLLPLLSVLVPSLDVPSLLALLSPVLSPPLVLLPLLSPVLPLLLPSVLLVPLFALPLLSVPPLLASELLSWFVPSPFVMVSGVFVFVFLACAWFCPVNSSIIGVGLMLSIPARLPDFNEQRTA